MRPLIVAFWRRGFTVALLGPGAGTTTLARALAQDPQIRARVVHLGANIGVNTVAQSPMPRRERRRHDELPAHGRSNPSLPAHGKRLTQQVWLSLVALVWGLRGRVVVFDGQGCSTSNEEPLAGLATRMVSWLFARVLVRPDLVLLLDAPDEAPSSRNPARQVSGHGTLRVACDNHFVLGPSRAKDETIRRAKSLVWSRYRRGYGRSAPSAALQTVQLDADVAKGSAAKDESSLGQ